MVAWYKIIFLKISVVFRIKTFLKITFSNLVSLKWDSLKIFELHLTRGTVKLDN